MKAIHEIREAREKAGFTILQLAVAAGVDPSTVWRWENGKGKPQFGGISVLRDTLAEMINEKIGKLADLHDRVQSIKTQ